MSAFGKISCYLLFAPVVLGYTGFCPANADKICDQGFYLYSCGSKVVGTNWLKGMSDTANYYCDNAKLSDTVHVTNLRKFFAGLEPISCDTEQTFLPEDYIKDRDKILSTFCVDEEGNLNVVCKQCPNEAFVAESYAQKSTTSREITWSSWNVRTIVNCYMDKFSDATGTYVYIPDNVAFYTTATETSTTSAGTNSADTQNKIPSKNCYYSTNVEGSLLK